MCMTEDVPWLSDAEQRIWRSWLKVNAQISATLAADLLDDSGLSMPDFHVLVHLTDSPEGRVRVNELAQTLQWERSRVSHHLTRMERRDLVVRSECSDDRRGAFIAVTAAGRAAIERAAPGHVRAVRRLFFDVLAAEEVSDIGASLQKLLASTDFAQR